MILENLLLNNEDIMVSCYAHSLPCRRLPTHKLSRVMPDGLLSYLASYCKNLGITTRWLSKNRELWQDKFCSPNGTMLIHFYLWKRKTSIKQQKWPRN